MSDQVEFDGCIFFLLADATQIIDLHEFATFTTRMKASVYSKMSATASAPPKNLTDSLSVSQLGA